MTPGPTLAKAWIEDAIAIASLAESQGFPEDAQVMREFAQKLQRQWRVKAVAS